MNKLPKVVFSRTLDKAQEHTKLVKGDWRQPCEDEELPGKDWRFWGSGALVSQLAQEGLSMSSRSW